MCTRQCQVVIGTLRHAVLRRLNRRHLWHLLPCIMSHLGIPDTLVARPYSAAPALPLLRQCAPLQYQTDGVAGSSVARKPLQQQRQASDSMHALLYEWVEM